MTELPTVDKRSRRIYVYWAIALGLLLTLGLVCWQVVLPCIQVREAVERCAGLSYAKGWIGPAHEEIARLGGPERAARRFSLYLRLPERLAPHRGAAVDILGECGEPAIPELLRLLKDKDWNVRGRAGWVLGCMNDVERTGPFVAALEDEDEYVRYVAARALGRVGDPGAVEPLKAALRDKDEDVRKAARQALKQIRPAARGGP